jgi:hypothetical protein
MGIIELIADRRIREAQAEGFFDDLPGSGGRIADLDRQRASGWWAKRTVEHARDRDKAERLRADIKATLTAAWRLSSPDEVRACVDQLNERIATYNRWTTVERIDTFDPDDIEHRWRDLRRWLADRAS